MDFRTLWWGQDDGQDIDIKFIRKIIKNNGKMVQLPSIRVQVNTYIAYLLWGSDTKLVSK